MFLPKSFERKNHNPINLKIKNNSQIRLFTKDNFVKNYIKKRSVSSNNVNIINQGSEIKFTLRTEKQLLIEKYNAIPMQPSFIKTEKLKRRALSAK